MERRSFATRQNVAQLKITPETNGTVTVELRGYQNDQVEAIRIAVQEAVSTVMKGAAP